MNDLVRIRRTPVIGGYDIEIPVPPCVANLPYNTGINLVWNETSGNYTSCIIQSRAYDIFHFEFTLIDLDWFEENIREDFWKIQVAQTELTWTYLTYKGFNSALIDKPCDIVGDVLQSVRTLFNTKCAFTLDFKEKFLRLSEGE